MKTVNEIDGIIEQLEKSANRAMQDIAAFEISPDDELRAQYYSDRDRLVLIRAEVRALRIERQSAILKELQELSALMPRVSLEEGRGI